MSLCSDFRSFEITHIQTSCIHLFSRTRNFERTTPPRALIFVWTCRNSVWSLRLCNLTPRVEVSLISYKDHIWFHTVHTWFLSTILVWKQRNHIWSWYDYQEITYDPRTNTKNHTSIFRKSFTLYVFFCFYSVGHPPYDDPASHCDRPKQPNVQYHLQSWAQNKRVSPNR